MNRFDLDPKARRHNFAGSSNDTYIKLRSRKYDSTRGWYSPTLIILHSKPG